MRQIIRNIARSLLRRDSATVKGSTVETGARIENGAKVITSLIGHDAYVGPEARLFNVHLGPYASIGPRVTIGENEHEQTLFSTSDILLECITRAGYAEHRVAHTEIGPDVWIGANAFVRKGVKVGVGAIIGAHTVVLKDVPPYAIMVGVPARLIGYRFSPETCVRLAESRWWILAKDRLQLLLVQRYGRTETPAMQDEAEILAFIASLGRPAGAQIAGK
jgi:virginiamycin A acetyltransferase